MQSTGPRTSTLLRSRELITQVLLRFFEQHRGHITFLTGAGFSTESGIPDYRGEHGVYTRHPTYKPIFYQAFMQSHAVRQRYWARSFFGYLPVRRAQPNAGHLALTRLQQRGWLSPHGGITQNVDGLHEAAGTARVIELHGALRHVGCTQCAAIVERDRMQLWLEEMNPAWAAHLPSGPRHDASLAWQITPDGDVEIAALLGDREQQQHQQQQQRLSHAQFRYPSCMHCGGIYKPSVVFFGESIPRHVHRAADACIRDRRALLVMGTSVTVGSAMRVVRMAKPREVAVVNLGGTRADSWADIRVEASCPQVLSWMEALLPA
ncbi:silent information regulator protein Sir2 [Syncephalis pseudoplumigaleata]|uniref:Silent information regulator protein Sir2 n=1 Tax=Syncephalis pseudoplumigaleata TaxID=1712513 RepID=A0A4P9Z434_9FUNG|nr:silent information regulator protein Sir2 [Syncephalis pseudoplumigaleata]|eukprot:RKP27246.1 silent information regulator protein Sir2 [Syncephalis pseudoplumigaleata]